MSFPVCFWYDFKAASKMTWKREESAAVAGVWDMKGVATGEERKNPDDDLPAAVNAGRGSRVCGATAAQTYPVKPQQEIGNRRCKRDDTIGA